MNKIALTLPGFSPSPIPNPSGLNPEFIGPGANLASFLSPLLNIIFYIAIFLAFFWLVWASFQYIMASGNKESLAKAREKIKWALIGLVIIFAAFFIAKLAGEIFPPGKGGLPF